MNFVADKNQDEKLGEYIARTRSERDLSHEDLSQMTKVSINYLKAIEASDWKAFPVEAYLRGYLNSISVKLNLDPKKVLNWYSLEVGAPLRSDFVDVSSHEKIKPVAESEIKKSNKVVPIVIIIIGLAFLVASHFLDVLSLDLLKTGSDKNNEVAVADSSSVNTVLTDSVDAVEIPEGAEKVPEDTTEGTLEKENSSKNDSSSISVSQAVVDEAIKKSDLPASATIFISSDSKKDSVETTNKTSFELIGSGQTNSWVGLKNRDNADRFLKEANISKAGMKLSYNTEDTLFVTIGEPKAISKMLLNGVETPLPVVRYGRVVKLKIYGGEIIK